MFRQNFIKIELGCASMTNFHVRLVQNHMATEFRFVISCDSLRTVSAEQVLRESHRLVSLLESELSEFLENSPVSRLNSSQKGERIVVPPSVWHLYRRSLEMQKLTEGSFDATVKSLSSRREPRFGGDGNAMWKEDGDARLSFGAIGKGYALDRVRVLVEREGFHDFILDAGGSSQILSGFSDMETPWKWGWSWSRDEEGNDLGVEFEHRTGDAVSLGISGYHEKGRHILDARNATKATSGKTALIGHDSATDADALSTALLVAGWEASVPLMEQSATPAMAMVESDDTTRWNGRFQALWGSPLGALLLWLFQLPSMVFGEEESFDLSDLGFEDFTPYMIERDSLWVLLPALSLLLVLIHLQKPKKERVRPQKMETIE